MNHLSNADRFSEVGRKAIHDHWFLFIAEGLILIALGLLAAVIPFMSNVPVTVMLGWLFLVSGIVGLATTFWARHAVGYVWSLVSALLGILVGASLIAQRTQDLYGGPLGWPFERIGSLWLVLALFFFVEGFASIMLALDHRRQFSGRWAWMLASGVIDMILASVVLFGFQGGSAWTMGLLVGINMVVGGASLLAMGLHARAERADLK